ncbi:MAG: alpha/beta fold hydrolase [Ilumatobacter sp.]
MTSLTATAASDLFRRAPDRYLDVDAGAAACWSVGSGPDVLFVHGWPVSGATFRLLLPHLVDHVTCHVIDLPGAGSSRFDDDTPLSVEGHFSTVRRCVDLLDLDEVAVVGHDSGGMIARHALAGDPRLRAMGLINTEQPSGLGWRFKMFLAGRHVPGFAGALGWAAGKPAIRRNKFILGDAFADRSLLDGEFDEFFLQPLRQRPERLRAAVRLLKTFDAAHVSELASVHANIDVPVQMVWGDQDPFFPLASAEQMVSTFTNAALEVIEGAGLFSHEERPAEVAAALLPVLAATRP